jgi:hypothetical protein
MEKLTWQQRQREDITRILARSWKWSTSGQTPPALLASLPPDDRAELERVAAQTYPVPPGEHLPRRAGSAG